MLTVAGAKAPLAATAAVGLAVLGAYRATELAGLWAGAGGALFVAATAGAQRELNGGVPS